MKVSKVSAIILITILVSSAFNNLQSNKMIPKHICKVAKDILNSTMDTQDVLIGNLVRNT